MNKKIILSLFCFAALLFFTASPTASAALTQSQIDNIRAQIIVLQQQLIQLLSAQNATPSNWCHTFTANMKLQDNNSEVNALNTALLKQGYYVIVSNYFAQETFSAVVQFQEKYASDILTPSGLAYGTGYAGPKTRAKLNTLYGCSQSPTSTSTPLQEAMAVLSLSPARVNAGASAFTLTITGTGFVNGATVSFNGTNRTVTFVNGTRLTISIPASDVTAAGNYWVLVKNPDGKSSSKLFYVIKAL